MKLALLFIAVLPMLGYSPADDRIAPLPWEAPDSTAAAPQPPRDTHAGFHKVGGGDADEIIGTVGGCFLGLGLLMKTKEHGNELVITNSTATLYPANYNDADDALIVIGAFTCIAAVVAHYSEPPQRWVPDDPKVGLMMTRNGVAIACRF